MTNEQPTFHVGERVFVNADNYGSEAVIIEYRDSTNQLASHWKVRQDDGQEFWALDFEVLKLTFDSTPDTLKHIARVQELIGHARINLLQRGARHDASKLCEPEKSVLDVYTPLLRDTTYPGPPRIQDPEFQAYLQHHYANNSHHPEFYPVPTSEEIENVRRVLTVIEQWPEFPPIVRKVVVIALQRDIAILESRVNHMSLLDILEHLCDCKAASERHADGNFARSLEINRKRFGYSDQLYNLMVNTAVELGWLPKKANEL